MIVEELKAKRIAQELPNFNWLENKYRNIDEKSGSNSKQDTNLKPSNCSNVQSTSCANAQSSSTLTAIESMPTLDSLSNSPANNNDRNPKTSIDNKSNCVQASNEIAAISSSRRRS